MILTKKIFPFIAVFIIVHSLALGQIEFEPGYIIYENGDKIQCLIKNQDWLNNPTKIKFKLGENDLIQIATDDEIQEFGISGVSKFIKAKVNIDRSSHKETRASSSKDPIWSEEVLLLKLMVEGDANLYFFKDSRSEIYFSQNKEFAIEQLVSKHYYVEPNKKAWNHLFRRQLISTFNCIENTHEVFSKLEYKRKSLLKYFVEENICRGSEFLKFDDIDKRKSIHLKITPGLKSSNLKWLSNNNGSIYDIYFEKKATFRLGIEVEYIFPFHKNKWGLFTEPTFQSYNADNINDNPTIHAKYQSIEFPFGLRHYFYLRPNLTIYLNVAYVIDYEFKSSSILFDNPSRLDFRINSLNNFDFGLACLLQNKYSVEFRHHTNRQSGRYIFWNTPFKSTSIIFGYRIF